MTSPYEVPSRGHHIPLGRQLAATLEAAIRDRHIPPGARLPSTRDLARQLGLDRGTVGRAYDRLRRRRCAVSGRGRRLRVRPSPGAGVREPDASTPGAGAGDPSSAARALAAAAVAKVLAEGRESGISRHLLRESIIEAAAGARRGGEGRTAPVPPGRLTLYEPRPGLRRALAAELSARLGVPVDGPAPVEARSATGAVLLRSDVSARLAGPEAEWVRFTLAGGTRERGIARRSAPFGLVVLLSVSESVRAFATELAAREADRRMSFVALDPESAGEVVRATAAARLVLLDHASVPYLPPTRARVEPIHLVPAYEVAALRGYLDLGSGDGGEAGRPARRGS